MHRAALLVLLAAFTLACAGGGGGKEKERLRMELATTQQALAEAQARLATCTCPDEAPVIVETTARAPAAEPAAAPPRPPVDSDVPGEIEVKATSAVQILVDGKAVPYNLAKSAYIKKNLEPGPHLLEVQTPGIRTVGFSETVQVPPGKRLRYQHKLGTRGLSALGTVDASSAE